MTPDAAARRSFRLRPLLCAGLLAGSALAREPARHRPDALAGLTAAERKTATYAALRFGPGQDDVLLMAFLSATKGDPAHEVAFLVPGHPDLGALQRQSAERRRRGEDGPAIFRNPVTLPLNRNQPPQTLEIVELEKRPGQGRLAATVRLAHDHTPASPSLLLQGTWRQTSGGRTVIAHLPIDPDSRPTLTLRSIQRGRLLYAALRFGDWDIVFPDRRPGIPAQALTAQGLPAEASVLRPTEDVIERVYNWSAEFRRLRGGETYTFRVQVRPGPGFPELSESVTILVPEIP